MTKVTNLSNWREVVVCVVRHDQPAEEDCHDARQVNSLETDFLIVLSTVLRIRIRLIHIFLGLLDPDPLVRCTDPDPIIKQR